MQKLRLKKLLNSISYDEQKQILMVFNKWIEHQQLVEIKLGLFPLPEGGIDEIRNMDPTFESRLDDAVANKDKFGSLKIGLADIFRGMLIMQKESIGPKFNAFFKRHLPEKLFRLWYEAAGLDVDRLVFDFEFADLPVNDL